MFRTSLSIQICLSSSFIQLTLLHTLYITNTSITMPPPSLWTRIRHTLGRAFRETGQAIDRVALRASAHANHSQQQVGKFGSDPIYKFQEPLSRHRNFMPLLRRGDPQLVFSPSPSSLSEEENNNCFIAPCSSLIGHVRIGKGSSVWYGAILRADQCNMGIDQSKNNSEMYEQWKNNSSEFDRQMESQQLDGISAGGGIFIGENSNVQDGVIITSKQNHTNIGDYVTIGHSAQIHSATVESYSLIGMGSILKPNCKVESYSLIAAGAVVEEGVTVKRGELWVGNPAKKLRDLSEEEQFKLRFQAEEYVKVAATHCHVMELGGNIPDAAFQELQQRLPPSTSSTSTSSDTTMKKGETSTKAQKTIN